MNRHISRRDMTDTEKSIFDAWMVYHGINLQEASTLEFTGYGYLHVTYQDGPDMIVALDLMVPAWL